MTQQVLQKSTSEVLQQFMQVVLTDQELQEQLKVAADRESFTRLLVDLGAESGYSFSNEDVQAMILAKETASSVKSSHGDLTIAKFRSEQTAPGW